MSITDELRRYIRDRAGSGISLACNKRIANIADRIDKAVESEYVKLPKDADGEPIHINDVMDTEHFGTITVEGFVHRSVAFYNYSEQPAYLCTTPAELCRHHHEPTVEDVMVEFATDWECAEDGEDKTAVLKEYAGRIMEVVEDDRD